MKRRDFLIFAATNLALLINDVRPVMSQLRRAGIKHKAQSSHLPHGIYAVTNTANWVIRDGKRINLFEYEFVDGVTNYARWADIEKEERKYNWSSFDRLIREAAENSKKLSYNIISGNHAPEWLYQRHGISPYEYSTPRKNNRMKTFLPWVTVKGKRVLNTSVLEIWENTIASFARHISNHPLRNVISYIAITGGPTGNGLEISWPKGYYEEFSKLNWDEEAERLLVQFWIKLTDIFIKHIPLDIPLGLAFTDLFGVNLHGAGSRNITIPKTVVDHALQVSKTNKRVTVPMGLWLGNINPDELKGHPLLKLITGFNEPFALQGDLETLHKERLEKMLSLSVDVNASWIELWHSDIINEDYSKIISETGNRIKGINRV